MHVSGTCVAGSRPRVDGMAVRLEARGRGVRLPALPGAGCVVRGAGMMTAPGKTGLRAVLWSGGMRVRVRGKRAYGVVATDGRRDRW